ncbi:MAG: DUF3857 domain-containing protein, partial [Thermoguttaceae bacterium]
MFNAVWLSETTFAAQIPPERIGYYIGLATPVILLLAGILKCKSIAARETTNTKAALSLMLVLVGWLAAMGAGMANRLAIDAGMASVGQAISVLVALVVFILVIAAIVLAIIGLIELSDGRGFYRQGKVQAILSLVLAGIFVVLIVLGVGAAVRQQMIARGRADLLSPNFTSATHDGEPRVFEELNFNLSPPAPPWVEIENIKKINPAATVGFARQRPEMMFFVIGERLGVEMGFDSEALCELVKVNLRGNAPGATFSTPSPRTFNGLPGLFLTADATVATKRLHYVYWLCENNGFLYQLILFTPGASGANLTLEAEALFSGFHLQDRNLVAHAPNVHPAVDFQSNDYGYRLNWDGSRWSRWSDLADVWPQADTGALLNPNAACLVIPVHLLGHRPTKEAICGALLALFDIPYPSDTLTDHREITNGDLMGRSFGYDKMADDGRDFRYRVDVFSSPNEAYLIMAWVDKTDADVDSVLEDACGRIRFEPSTGPTSVAAFSQSEALRHAMFFNTLGNDSFVKQQFEKAIVYFRQAMQIQPDNPLYLANLVTSYTESSRYAEAFDVLDEHYQRFPEVGQLSAERAWLQCELNRPDAAMDEYTELFSEGYRNDDHFSLYLTLLSSAGRYDAALAALQHYREVADSPALALQHAGLISAKGEHDRAAELLVAMRPPRSIDPDIEYSLANVYEAAGRYHNAIEVVERLIEGGFDSANAYYRKGTLEIELKSYKEAKASFEAALMKAPENAEIKESLDFVSAMLGEGANSSIKNEIPPVPLPEQFAAEPPKAAQPASPTDEYNAVYLRKIRAFDFQPGTPIRRTDYMSIELVEDSAVDQFSTIQRSFDPLIEEIYVNQLEVYDDEGRLVATGDVADYYVIDDLTDEMASQDKLLQIPVPGLQQGYRIELVVSRRNFARAEHFPFERHIFSSTIPVREAGLVVRGDPKTIAVRGSAIATGHEFDDGIYFRLVDPPVYRWEP